MNRVIAVFALSLSTAQASQTECLSRIIYAESRGEPLECAAITAKAAINRNKDVCSLIKSGVVKAKPIPRQLQPYFSALSIAAYNTRQDIAMGADSWNTGNKPAYRGDVKRICKGHVYYEVEK